MARGMEQELLGLCERGVQAASRAGATAVEVYAERDRSTKVGFQKNDLDTVSIGEETVFGVRVVVDGRLGFATANNAAALEQVAAEAVDIARSSPPDEHNLLPEPQPVPDTPPLCDDSLARLDASALARHGRDLLAALLDRREARLPGARLTVDSMDLSAHEHVVAVASSTGVRAAHRTGWAQGGVFGMAIDGDEVGSFSYDGDAVRTADELGPALSRAFERFGAKCMGALGARKGESFRGPVLVPADALESFLLGTLLSTLSAKAVRLGLSPFADKVGERIAVPGFTLVEGGPGLPGHPLTPFDREGQPRQRLPLVQDGVLQGFLYDSAEAARVGRRSTGHAIGDATSLPGIGATSLSLDGGSTPLASLGDLERGIVLTRFSGSVEASSGDFSGVVKGGFLIRDGERIPVRETTIAGNLWTALKQIRAISAEQESFYGMRALPAVVFDDISVTAG